MRARIGRALKGAAERLDPSTESAPSCVRPPPAASEIKVGSYVHYIGKMPEFEADGKLRALPLYTPAQMDSAVRELRTILAADETPECRAALATPFGESLRAFAGGWFQRIEYPKHGISSTSDHGLAYIDEGSFNTLGQRLTSREACILRPMPKWRYIRPLLPQIEGKSVLELGSSNGFFSFRFAELGASHVTGVEIVQQHRDIAAWSADVLGHGNVEFLHTDFLLDLSIRKHDVVFLSEVHNHFLFPFYGILRLVNLARETIILDTVSSDAGEHSVSLHSGWNIELGRMIYHSFHLSHGMLVDYLNLIGIPPSKITRYTAPDEPFHNLYVIDTRSVEETRARRNYSEYLLDVLALKFKA